MFTTAGMGGVGGGGGCRREGRGDASFFRCQFFFWQRGVMSKNSVWCGGDMDKFCLFNIDIGARAKTGKEEREGGGADTVV